MRKPGASPGRSRRCEETPDAETPLAARPKAAKGEPRVRRLAALPAPNPSRKEDSCFARSSLRGARRGRARAVRARRQRQDPGRGQDDHDLRRRATARRRRQPAPGARPRQRRGEFHYAVATASFGVYVSQIKYLAAGTSGWVFKVNGVSPPVGADKVAEGRRHRPLVLRDLGAAEARRRSSCSGCRATATSSSRSTTPKRTRAAAATSSPTASGRRRRRQSLHRRPRRASSGRLRPAPSARTRCSDPPRCQRALLVLLAGCGGSGRRGGGDGPPLGDA